MMIDTCDYLITYAVISDTPEIFWIVCGVVLVTSQVILPIKQQLIQI